MPLNMSVSRQILPAASQRLVSSLHIHVFWLATDCFTLECLDHWTEPVIIRAAQYSNDSHSQNCWYKSVISPCPSPHLCRVPHCRHAAVTMMQWSMWEQCPGSGYIAPSTIRLTSVWTQTCINLQEDKLQALASSGVNTDIFISNLLRELLRRDGSRMQWY